MRFRLTLRSMTWMTLTCYKLSNGPAQMMTSHTDVLNFVIFHAIQRKKFHDFIHKKGFDFWGSKSHHWHQIPYRHYTPRPHWMTSQTPLLHARQVFRRELRWLNPRSLHKNFWVYIYAEWPIIDINTCYFSVEIVLIAQSVIFMIFIRRLLMSWTSYRPSRNYSWPKRAPECIKMHHFEGEHAKIFLGRGTA